MSIADLDLVKWYSLDMHRVAVSLVAIPPLSIAIFFLLVPLFEVKYYRYSLLEWFGKWSRHYSISRFHYTA